MISDAIFTAPAAGARLDAAILAAFPSSSRAFVRDAIAAGAVSVDGRCAPKGMKLRGGERVEIASLAEKSDNTVRPDAFFRPACVFEDDSLLAFDKPAGMPVQPVKHGETGTLMNAVAAIHPECIPLGDRPLMAGAVHRIDSGTSGLVLVARTRDAFDAMRAQFAAQSVRKTYLALVEGAVAVGGTLEHDLVHDPSLPYCKMIPAGRERCDAPRAGRERALHAVTRFRPVANTTVECETRTLLEVEIFTGVTHQIRAQLALAGMHIVNDTLYGAFAVEGATGHCLHALSAAFKHPATGQDVCISTPWPPFAVF